MEKRSDLRNRDFFPPALDTALVLPFSARCWPFPFTLQRLCFQSLCTLACYLAFYPSWSCCGSTVCSRRTQLSSAAAGAPGRAVPAGALVVPWLSAVVLGAAVARQAQLLAAGCGSACCTHHLELPGCSGFPLENKEDKVISGSVLRLWVPLQHAMPGGWSGKSHFALRLSKGDFQTACRNALEVQGVM